jgi:hypothetical protein
VKELLRARFENGFEEMFHEVGDFIGIRREDFLQILQIYIFISVFAFIPVGTRIVGIEITLAGIIICTTEWDAIENYTNHPGSD